MHDAFLPLFLKVINHLIQTSPNKRDSGKILMCVQNGLSMKEMLE